MKTQRTILGIVMIFILLFTNVSTVYALPPLPSTVSGTVKVDGVNVPAGTSITAWINGVQYASTIVSLYAGDTVYSLDVPGDDPASAGVIEGGVEGNTIVFHIGDLIAVETGTWHSGVPATLNLTNPGYTLSITSAHSTVVKSPDKAYYHDGEVVQLTATADSGWAFSNWSGGVTGATNPIDVTIHGNTSVTANYSAGLFTLNVSKTGAGSGTITSSPTGINCGSTCSYDFTNGTEVTLTAAAVPGSYFNGWSGETCSGTGPCVLDMTSARSISAEFKLAPVPTGLTCTNLNPKPATTSTSDKPQSKVWNYGGSWYAVFPTNSSGASSAGTWVWKLVGTTWNEVVKISDRTDTHADVLTDGPRAHILLWQDSNTQLSSIEYVSGAYQLWSTRNSLVGISLPGSETATIAIDSTGKMWLATRTSAGEIVVYQSNSPYSTWNGPIVLETGVIGSDDIDVITALPNGTIGVFWSNENPAVYRFGFKYHIDGQAVSTWSANEVPASQSAVDGVGLGMADDHMNVAVASDSTLYVAVKTSYDTTGYPKMALLVRRPNGTAGTWDNLYPVDQAGTRPNILLDEVHGFLSFLYTSAEGYNPIVYQQSSTASINFDGRKTLRAESFNDVSSMKGNYDSSFVVIYASATDVGGQICAATSPDGADLAISKTDGKTTVHPNDPLTYTITAQNNGPVAVTGASVTDTLPAALTGVTWTCTGSGGGTCSASGSGNIDQLVNLSAGASVTFTVNATVDILASGDIANSATITTPLGISDPNQANNTATDTDALSIPVTPCNSDASLVGCWQMEENGGSALFDGSSYSNDAALFGSPAWAAGKVGSYALDLNGSSQYASVPDNASLDLTNQITIAAWIKPEQYNTQDVIKKATNGSINGYELSLATTKGDSSSQRVFFRMNQVTSGDIYRINATTMYPIDGTWMHAAATFDGTTMRLYINGVLESSLTPPAGTTIATNNVPLTIGAQNDASRYYMGWLDDARVYNRALSLNEIQVLAGVKPTYTISGNAGVPGATIGFTGGSPVTADGSGDYTITVDEGWTGTVTPSLAGYTFDPANRPYANVLANQTGQDFAATAITYTISGNAGVAGATISFTGGTPVTSSGTGAYSITVPYNWTGTVTPSLTGYTFDPVNRPYSNVLANQTGQDFAATAITYTISGNAGVAGATISFTGGTPVIASGTGAYSITVPYNWTGTVTPSLAGYTFNPANRPYANVLANQTGQDFAATAITYTISGNAGVAGATISFTGGTPVTASGTGAYSITVPYNWTGTVTPSLTGYTFDPTNRPYSNVLANQTGQDFAATAITYTISGNAGVAGATVSFTGGTPVSASGSGAYSITVPYNWTGTVTPSLTGYTFDPANRPYSNVLANQTGQDFVATLVPYLLSVNKDGTGSGTVTSNPTGIDCGSTCSYSFGYNTLVTLTANPSAGSNFTGWTGAGCSGSGTCQVTMNIAKSVTATFTAITYTISGNAGIAGATISFTGGTPVTASGTGAYNITVPYNWTGTVTPSLTGYTFDPANRPYANVLANQTGQNFAATAITYTISGNAGVAGATISFTGGTPVTASGTGAYSITVPYNWTGTVTPSLTGYTFDPANRPYSNVLANQTGQDFAAMAITYTISGNAGVAGATISFTGGTPVTASGTGAYSITVPYNWTGTVTPSLTGYTFDPTNRPYSNVLANQTGQDFAATAITYTISGNAGVAGATVSFTGGTPVIASGTGAYSITVPYDWTGTVTPSLAGYTFDPANRPYSNVLANRTLQNYSAIINTYLLSVSKIGTGTGTVTSSVAGVNCGADCSETYDHGTLVILTATPTSNYHRFLGWTGSGCTGNGTCSVTVDAAKTITAEFEASTFTDVPFDHPRWAYIEALYDNGYTSGCQAAGNPLKFCPADTMIRGESAVFMLRGKLGAISTPTDAEPYVFGDYWEGLNWAQPWAEKMWDEGMTAGCQYPAGATPKMFCPWTQFSRNMGAVFGLRIKHGSTMPVPVGSGDVFADMTSIGPDGIGIGWAEQAYAEGLLPACGTDLGSGKPLFCPADQLDRSWSAFMIAVAKGLALPE